MADWITLHVPGTDELNVQYYFDRSVEQNAAHVWPFHVHDRLEMYVLLEGDVSFAVESSLYKLTAGDAIISRPNEMHNCILSSDSVHKHLCFWFDSSSEYLFGDFLAHSFGEGNLISPDEDSKARLLTIYEELYDAMRQKDVYAQHYLILQMLGIFRRFISTQAGSVHMPEVLKQILCDIELNFDTINSLDYFTEKYYLSLSTLSRLFKTHLHTTPKMYLESKKLAYSRRLLKNGESVLAACMKSGFGDYSNYIRIFKKRFGITPRQYKYGEIGRV